MTYSITLLQVHLVLCWLWTLHHPLRNSIHWPEVVALLSFLDSDVWGQSILSPPFSTRFSYSTTWSYQVNCEVSACASLIPSYGVFRMLSLENFIPSSRQRASANAASKLSSFRLFFNYAYSLTSKTRSSVSLGYGRGNLISSNDTCLDSTELFCCHKCIRYNLIRVLKYTARSTRLDNFDRCAHLWRFR